MGRCLAFYRYLDKLEKQPGQRIWSAVGAREAVEAAVAVHQQNRRQQGHVVAKSKHAQVCTQCLELA